MDTARVHRRLAGSQEYGYRYLEAVDLPKRVENTVWVAYEASFAFVHRMVCAFTGHEVIDDTCGMPAHRFCIRCSTSFPYGMTRGILTLRR